jgi:valyl-tRNA synthetase
VHPLSISLAAYPQAEPAWEDPDLEERMAALMAVVTRVRALRAELGLPARAPLTLHLAPADQASAAFLREQEPLLRFLLRPQELRWEAPPEGVPQDLVAGVRLGLVSAVLALSGAERQRLEGELGKLEGAIAGAEARLGDAAFLGKAPPHVVEQQRLRLDEMLQRREQIRQGLDG